MIVSTSPDSSRPRIKEAPAPRGAEHAADVHPAAVANDVDSWPSRPAETDKSRRSRLLTSDRLHKSIRKVARNRDVPADEVDDILQETIARAWTAKLPDKDDEVPKYVNRIAANVSCERMGKAPELEPYIENADEEEGNVATAIAVPPPCFETRDVVSQLVEKGEEQFPRGFPGYMAAKVTGGTAHDVAKARGVSPGHVRHEWSDIRSFMSQHGRRMGLSIAGLLVLVIGGFTWWPRGDDRVLMPAPPEPELRLRLEAATLRHRAEDECAANAWRACVDDLDAANRLAPADETPELRDLRTLAKHHLEAKPPRR